MAYRSMMCVDLQVCQNNLHHLESAGLRQLSSAHIVTYAWKCRLSYNVHGGENTSYFSFAFENLMF